MAIRVTTEAVQARLGRSLDDAELARAEALLDEAWLLVTRATGNDYADASVPLPPEVPIVVSRMVARTLSLPAEAAGAESWQEQWGPFMGSMRYAANARDGGVWLSKADKELLGITGGSPAVSVSLASPRYT